MKKLLDRFIEILTCTLLVLMVLVASWQVFTRFVLSSPSTVSEEFLRYGLIWLSMVGGAYVYGKKKHLAIVFLVRKIPGKFQGIINLLVEICVMTFAIFILIFGGSNAFQNAVGQVSPALQMPMEYLYLCLPVGGVMFLLYSIFGVVDSFKKNKLITNEEN
ncbi:TRAP transporter small permease [Neobacillus sp. DY30]|uniref:TRAP transporter small permease n=1 Tax=Neobacillus sp. DY30 TaxID=3047871 RepID=UPI0024BFD2E5|nr:TRAP transporter small permease [Neobacillus sp. DY30]WHY01697.1 TRAP transporter small permease [Neobacillus sp. DY30]